MLTREEASVVWTYWSIMWHLTRPEFSRGVSLVAAVTATLHVSRSLALIALCCLHFLAGGSGNVEAEEEEEEEDDDGEEQGAGSQNTWLWVWMTAGLEHWPVSVRMDKLTLVTGLQQKIAHH